MSEHDYNRLLSSLDTAADILNQHRTPDPLLVAAYDTVKQAKARVIKAFEGRATASPDAELVAA